MLVQDTLFLVRCAVRTYHRVHRTLRHHHFETRDLTDSVDGEVGVILQGCKVPFLKVRQRLRLGAAGYRCQQVWNGALAIDTGELRGEQSHDELHMQASYLDE